MVRGACRRRKGQHTVGLTTGPKPRCTVSYRLPKVALRTVFGKSLHVWRHQ